jgi:uncharacterized membrane protein YhfC
MKLKRRTVISIIWAIVVLLVLINWLKGRSSLPPDQFQLFFSCNGEAGEKQFLLEQADTIVEDGLRRFTSANGFVTYKIAIGDCELERAFWAINQVEFRLEFSQDGKEWSTIVHIGKLAQREPEKFSNQSCGLLPDKQKAASEAKVAYYRFRPSGELGDSRPVIKHFGLKVSGPAPPEHFHKFSLWPKFMRLLPARLMVLAGLVPVIILRKWWKTPWRLFALGAVLWIVSVAAKLGFAFLANNPVEKALHAILPTFPADLAFWLYVGLLTGIFECGIFLLLIKYIRRRQWTFKDAASVGVGFGAVEAIALGVGVAIATSIKISVSGELNLAVVVHWHPPVERLIALAVHAASVAMIIYALTQRKWRWFVASFLYKSGVDALASFVFLARADLMKTHPWFVELGLFGPFACAGLCILLLLRRLWNKKDEIQATAQVSSAD